MEYDLYAPWEPDEDLWLVCLGCGQRFTDERELEEHHADG